jgi:hypothetical protein
MTEKFIGYLLLLVGIVMIIGSALGVYFVFSPALETQSTI